MVLTNKDIDERLSKYNTFTEKLEYLEEWLFMIEMCDHWDRDDYLNARLLNERIIELKGFK